MQTDRIYKSSKTATQSGKSKTHRWVMEYIEKPDQYSDPLIGWTASNSTLKEITLYFDSLVAAEQFAEAKNLTVVTDIPHERVMTTKSYANNFKFDRLY